MSRFNEKYVQRYAELLTAIPELSVEEIERLKRYKPRLNKTAFFVALALKSQQVELS